MMRSQTIMRWAKKRGKFKAKSFSLKPSRSYIALVHMITKIHFYLLIHGKERLSIGHIIIFTCLCGGCDKIYK